MTNFMTFDNDATICVISEDAKGMLDPDSGHLENKEAKKTRPSEGRVLVVKSSRLVGYFVINAFDVKHHAREHAIICNFSFGHD
jgi:hypothetical protein